jgi:hypothetical protein
MRTTVTLDDELLPGTTIPAAECNSYAAGQYNRNPAAQCNGMLPTDGTSESNCSTKDVTGSFLDTVLGFCALACGRPPVTMMTSFGNSHRGAHSVR